MNVISSYQLIKEIEWRPVVEASSSITISNYLPTLPSSVLSRICIPISVLNLSIIYNTKLTPFVLDIFKEVYKPRNPLALEERTGDRWLSPLHIAVISGNQNAVEGLVETGVQIDGLDKFHWAPIHHAALLGHTAILAFLLEKGADVRVTTNRKATYQTIQGLVCQSAYKVDKLTRLFWKDETGSCSRLTNGAYLEKTRAEFLEEYKATQIQIFQTWRALDKTAWEFPFIANLKREYESYLQNPLSHVLAKVTENSSGAALPFSPGLGIFAKEDVVAGQVLGEYFGKIVDDENSVQDKEYLLNDVDGRYYRNEVAQINDGFCNTIILTLYDERGLFNRYILVAIDSIKAGEQFCWNYGFGHGVKEGPYMELRPKEIREFIKEHAMDYLVECHNKTLAKKASLEEFGLAEKFAYLLDSPSVLFSLALEEALTTQESLLIQQTYIQTRLAENCPTDPLFYEMTTIAQECISLYEKLVDYDFPETASFYRSYVRALPEKELFLRALDLIGALNEYVTEYLDEYAETTDKAFLTSLQEGISEATA